MHVYRFQINLLISTRFFLLLHSKWWCAFFPIFSFLFVLLYQKSDKKHFYIRFLGEILLSTKILWFDDNKWGARLIMAVVNWRDSQRNNRSTCMKWRQNCRAIRFFLNFRFSLLEIKLSELWWAHYIWPKSMRWTHKFQRFFFFLKWCVVMNSFQ